MKFLITYCTILVLLIPSISNQAQETTKTRKELVRSITNYKNSNTLAGRYIHKRKILKASSSFKEITQAIKEGDIYADEVVEKGLLRWKYYIDSLEHYTIVIIPADYNSRKQYPVEFILHGAASNPNPYAVDNYVKLSKSEIKQIEKIIVYPAAWLLSPWWSKMQVKNLSYLLRRIKRNYSIDENRVTLSGISDGGTGSVYMANYLITPWSCFLPYISNPLSIPRLSEKELYLHNLGNRSFFFISTKEDQLFPTSKIQEFSRQLRETGNPHKLSILPEHGHDVKWFDNYRDSIKKFTSAHLRDPYPDSINWFCHDQDHGRNHWVIIDKIGKINSFTQSDFILRKEDSKPITYGSIQAIRKGNTILVKTKNVIKYRLLLSPEEFNFDEGVKVFTNGSLSFKGKLQKDPEVMLKWYWKDIDRSMLFASELKIRVK